MKGTVSRPRAALGAVVLVIAWSLQASAQPAAHGPSRAATHGAVSAPASAPAAAEPSEGAAPAGEPPESDDEAPAPINWWRFGGKNPPFLANIVNFAILAAGFYYLGRKGVGESLKKRRDTIAKEIEEAQAMKREAEARAETYRSKVERLEEEVRATREMLVQSGEAERERLVREAEAKADRMRKDAEFMVEQELDQLRKGLWRDAVEAAVVSAEALLKERITAADQERLADDFLKDLGARRSGSAAESEGVRTGEEAAP